MSICSLPRRSALALTASALLLAGCATRLSKPSQPPQPSSVKFGRFASVEMTPVTIADAFSASGPNQKAARKIDEHLTREMEKVFPGLKKVESFSSGENVLRIAPHIKEIKFIGGAARFWVGAMAGSSAVLMQVTYTGGPSVIADPEFYVDANAWKGGWSIGASDNMMLERVAMDVVAYTAGNK